MYALETQERSKTDRLGLFIYAVLMLLLISFVLVVDIWLAATLYFPFNLFVISLASVIALISLCGHYRKWIIPYTLAFTVTLLLLSQIDLNVAKPLERLRHAIQPGMTQAEADRLAAQYFPPGGRFGSLKVENRSENHYFYFPTGGERALSALTDFAMTDGIICMLTPGGRIRSCDITD